MNVLAGPGVTLAALSTAQQFAAGLTLGLVSVVVYYLATERLPR